MEKEERTVEEIQREILALAERLDRLASELTEREIPRLMDELESHFPDDPEAMGTDDVCPSLAWDTHGNLATVQEDLREALQRMRQAGMRSPETVRSEWLQRRAERESLRDSFSTAVAVRSFRRASRRSLRGIQSDALDMAEQVARLRFDLTGLVAELHRHHLADRAAGDRKAEDEPPSLAGHLAGSLAHLEESLAQSEIYLRGNAMVTVEELIREWAPKAKS